MDSPNRFTFEGVQGEVDEEFASLAVAASGGVMPTSARSGVSALTGESEFRTAHSTMSTVTGGAGSSLTSKEVGLTYVEDSSLFCKAVIGAADGIRRFCTKHYAHCKIGSHQESKAVHAEIKDGAMMIVPRKDQALEKPFAMKEWFEEEEFESLLDVKKQIPVWNEFFEARAREAGAKKAASVVELESLVDEEDDAWEKVVDTSSPTSLADIEAGRMDLMSPRKVKLVEVVERIPTKEGGNMEELLLETQGLASLISFMEEQEEKGLNPELLAAVGSSLRDWDKLKENFKLIGQQFTLNAVDHAQLKKGLMVALKKVEEKLETLDTKSGLLLSNLGKNEAQDQEGELSVWSAIHDLQMVVKGLGGSLDKVEQEVERVVNKLDFVDGKGRSTFALVEALDEGQKTLDEAATNKMRLLKDAVGFLVQRVDALEHGAPAPSVRHRTPYDEAMQALSEKMAEFERRHSIVDHLQMRDDLERLKREVERLGAREGRGGEIRRGDSGAFFVATSHTDPWELMTARASGGGGQSRNGTVVASFPATRQDSLRDRGLSQMPTSTGDGGAGWRALKDELEELRRKVQRISEKKAAGETYDDGEWVFHSKEDVETFLERTNLEIGWAWDLMSVLASMDRGKQTGRGVGDEYYSANRIESTIQRNKILAAIRSDRPACLFDDDGSGRAKPVTEGMAKVKSYHVWAATAEPYKNKLENTLIQFCNGIHGSMRNTSLISNPDEQEGVRFCKHLLVQVQSQWSALVGFFNTAYVELRFRCNFSEQQAWLLVGRYAAAIFNEMLPLRSQAMLLNDPTSLSNRATVLWAVLQSHRVMRNFIDLQFTGHVSITREMSSFMLLERVSPEEMTTLKRKFEENKDELESTKKKLKALEDKQVKLDGAIASLKSDMASMQNTWKQWKAGKKKD